MVMKKNKIMALAMLCSTFLSPVSKAHGGTKQGTEKSDTLENVKNKKSDNPKEMYNSRWKTNDIIKYFLETLFVGGVLGYGGKKVYNKYIRNPKIKVIKPKIEPKNLNINGKPKKVELSREFVAKKIYDGFAAIDGQNENSLRTRKIYRKVIESYKSQKNNEFKKVIETQIPKDEQNEKQFIALFGELGVDTINILLGGLTNEEQKFAKDNFKFYSFVWVCDYQYLVIAFAPKDKEIDLNGKKGKEAYNFDSDELFGTNFVCESYNAILKYCEINK